MRNLIVQVDAKNFHTLANRNVLLVDFWEPWCRPCQIQMRVLEEVALHLGKRGTVAKVNVDHAQKLAARLDIQSIPTLLLFSRGKVIRRFIGSHSSAALISAIEAIINLPESRSRPRKRAVATKQSVATRESQRRMVDPTFKPS